jgi:hypothetical protein
MSRRTFLVALSVLAALSLVWLLNDSRSGSPHSVGEHPLPPATAPASLPISDAPSVRAASAESPPAFDSLATEQQINLIHIAAARQLRADLIRFYRGELLSAADQETLSTLLARSPSEALAWITAKPAGEVREGLRLAFALIWARLDPDAAWAWAANEPGETLPVAVLVGAADDAATVRRLALPWLGAEATALDRRSISLYEALIHTPNAATANALADTLPGEQREYFFVRSFGDWSAQAPLDALAAVDTVRSVGERSRAFAAVVQHWPGNAVEDLQIFAQTIQDEQMRSDAIVRAAVLLGERHDTAALLRWINENPELAGYPVPESMPAK